MREQFNYTFLMQSKIKRVNEGKWFSNHITGRKAITIQIQYNTFKVVSKTTGSLEKLFNKIATDKIMDIM